ncbi:forkhead box protein D3-A-like [Stylophora pistillata]|uniref:forkhead box protein D3-A-like n=1 Tax=Stylophora pistillata TaxID=50429 RepID=UPI000C04222C|nr:forkhead box protein D3-A-like [Stylophora pistillata]
MTSPRFYHPAATTFPAFPYSFCYLGYTNTEISFRLPGSVTPCFHQSFHGIPTQSKNEQKPAESYISLIGKAILSSPQQKLVLGDIYNYILTYHPYFKNRRPGWRNSIRHNLSLNDCFVKLGRSPNGKGHFWAINPLNYEDFSRGDLGYRRKGSSKRNRRSISQEKKLQISTLEKGQGWKSCEDVVPQRTIEKARQCDNSFMDNERGLRQRSFHIKNILSD